MRRAARRACRWCRLDDRHPTSSKPIRYSEMSLDETELLSYTIAAGDKYKQHAVE